MLQFVTILQYFSGVLSVFIVPKDEPWTLVIHFSLFKGHRACFKGSVAQELEFA